MVRTFGPARDKRYKESSVLNKLRSRWLLAVVAGLMVFSTVFAFANSLGGITSTGLGADTSAVASCDTDGVTTSYATAYDTTAGFYEVTTVTVGTVDAACDGKTYKVSLVNGTTSAAEQTATITLSTNTFTTTSFASQDFDAELLTKIAVLITG
jgi:hypothetical protein